MTWHHMALCCRPIVLLLPAASATGHLSLSHFHCYCYSCPCLCHISAYYCSTLYIGLPAVRLGCIERVIGTAARLIGGIPRTGHVSAYMLDVLHWLPLQQRIMFRIGAMVGRCILGLARPTPEIFAIPPRAPEDAVHS